VAAKPIALFVLVLLVVAFIVQNASVAEVKFLFWRFEVSKAIIIFISLFVGFLAGLCPALRKTRQPKETEVMVGKKEEEKGEEK
jgi:uncharacterized integral membrane protein